MPDSKLQVDKTYCPVQSQENRKFPKAVILIVLNEFCERFSYSGMRAFLALYLKQKLYYTDDEATEVYHVFSTMVYFFPVFGAILADGYLGKFRTILYLMVVYVIGNLLLALTAIPPLAIPGREFTILGLMLVSLGTGGIKPCVSAFGGDQFILPDQEKQLTTFFSVFYFTICMGSLIAKTISPLLRSEVHCFGDKDCYSLAFGAPGILILSSIVMFVCAKNLYIIKKPSGNVILNVIKCITKGIAGKLSSKDQKKRNHWLDNAREYYDETFISDVKKTLAVFVLFIPLPVYWSLLDQLGSRWTLQAAKMDGDFCWFTVKPDQMQVLCPIVVLIFIPLFEKVVYPFLERNGILTNSLHKLTVGCILASISFICSGFLEIHLEKTYPVLPSQGLGQIRIFNGYNCDLHFMGQGENENFTIKPLDFYENKFISIEGGSRSLIYERIKKCGNVTTEYSDILKVEDNKAISYFYGEDNEDPLRFEDFNEKSRSGLPYVRIMFSSTENTDLDVVLHNKWRNSVEFQTNQSQTKLMEVFASGYDLYVNSSLVVKDIALKVGGVYTILLREEGETYTSNTLTVTEPNSLSMVWIFPQMIIISISEVLFAITGLEYAFKEAPESMKSVLQAYWLMIEAFGNILIIIVTRLGSDYRQVTQFFFYAILMLIATFLFYLLMFRHQKHKKKNDQNGKDKRIELNYEMVAQNDV